MDNKWHQIHRSCGSITRVPESNTTSLFGRWLGGLTTPPRTMVSAVNETEVVTTPPPQATVLSNQPENLGPKKTKTSQRKLFATAVDSDSGGKRKDNHHGCSHDTLGLTTRNKQQLVLAGDMVGGKKKLAAGSS
ncbi:hypothetical protein L6452_19709 [Arctium lappa]|uniref:Uncharacterized protein n=1 Tax=Arctium lappa TaxID=4217 RepID=A0ACB9BDQ5_ARCLA|nr:hypothetical protein L6452_19709 [Arctium lappa]